MAKITLDELVDITLAVEEGDPIDWTVFQDGKEQIVRMIGASILEQFDKESYSAEDRLIILSTMTKLVVENFVLNTKLLSQ
jgi:hypothetical protein